MRRVVIPIDISPTEWTNMRGTKRRWDLSLPREFPRGLSSVDGAHSLGKGSLGGWMGSPGNCHFVGVSRSICMPLL